MSFNRVTPVLFLTLFTSACSSDDDAEPCVASSPDPATFLAVEGFTIQHSLSKKAAEDSSVALDFSGIDVDLIDPGVLEAPTFTTLATVALETDGCGDGSGCLWRFSGIDLPETTAALVASIRDTRETDPLWATTFMTIADSPTVDALRSSQTALIDVRSFALTREALDSVIGPLVGLSGDTLLERGMVLGIVVGSAEGCGTQQPPQSGATVSSDRSDVQLFYPNSNVSGLSDKTEKQGMFFAVPDAGIGAVTTTFSITGALTWPADLPVWITPGVVSVQLFVGL